MLFKRKAFGFNSAPFILHPSAFILALHLLKASGCSETSSIA